MRILLAAAVIVVLAGATTTFADPFTSTPSYGGPGMKAWYGNGQQAATDPMSHRTHVSGHRHSHKHRTRTPR